jgi:hypothetical protein
MIRSSGRLAVASLVLVLSAGGCASMQVATDPPTQVIADRSPLEVQIRRVDGSRITLYRPTVRRDTIWGSTNFEYSNADGVVALSDVSAVFTPHVSAGKRLGA